MRRSQWLESRRRLSRKSGTVIESYRSVRRLNRRAMKIQAMPTPSSSPSTTQKALAPTA
jgi:hypothetical protein